VSDDPFPKWFRQYLRDRDRADKEWLRAELYRLRKEGEAEEARMREVSREQ
jgi:hypothetical protein